MYDKATPPSGTSSRGLPPTSGPASGSDLWRNGSGSTVTERSSSAATSAPSPIDITERLLTASALEQAGELDQAREVYQEVIDQDPESAYAEMARKALVGLAPAPESPWPAPNSLGSSSAGPVSVSPEDPVASPPPRSRNSSLPTLVPEGLMQKLFSASQLEQSGDIAQARSLYQEVLKLDPQGSWGQMAQKALESLEQDDQPVELGSPSSDQQSFAADQQPSGITSWISGLVHSWNNLGLRTKQTILLTTVAAVPIVALTVVNSGLAQKEVRARFEDSLQQIRAAFDEEYVLWIGAESAMQADALARIVEDADVNLNDPDSIAANRLYLQSILFDAFGAFDQVNPELTKSFRVITNSQGQTLIQFTQQYSEDFSIYPPIPSEDQEASYEYLTVSLPPGAQLQDVPIVAKVLEAGEPQFGMAVIPPDVLLRLGLNRQASIPFRPGEGDGSYDQGLASMAVHPVRQGGEVIGTVVVGSLLNRKHALTDNFQEIYDIPVASIYARDVLIATTAAYEDGQTRAIGIRAPAEVSDLILSGEQENVITRNRFGDEVFITAYSPLYDYRINSEDLADQAEPIGVIAVGQPESDLQGLIGTQLWISAGIGVVLIAVSAVLAILFADAFARPVRDLALFAQKVGSGQQGVRVDDGGRQDEIGVLARQMNEMAASIEINVQRAAQEQELRRQDAEQQRREKDRLQQSVINLLLEIEGAQKGDLTVFAPMNEGAIGSVADAFNTTIRSLRQLVLQVKAAAVEINALAETSSGSIQQLASRTLDQSEEVMQALEAVDVLNQSIQKAARSAQEAAFIAQQASGEAQQGDSTIERTVASMEKIKTTVDDTARKAEQLSLSSEEINKIATIISGISEKTHLLAFNASVEAVRAGEHGRGFRVVADEVRRLAQQVTDATKNIGQIVAQIQQEIAEVLVAMRAGTVEVTTGTQLVGEVQTTLQSLASLSQQIDHYLKTISGTTTAQMETSYQVNDTMERVVDTAQDTSAAAETVKTNLQDLTLKVRSLQESVSRFRLEA